MANLSRKEYVLALIFSTALVAYYYWLYVWLSRDPGRPAFQKTITIDDFRIIYLENISDLAIIRREPAKLGFNERDKPKRKENRLTAWRLLHKCEKYISGGRLHVG